MLMVFKTRGRYGTDIPTHIISVIDAKSPGVRVSVLHKLSKLIGVVIKTEGYNIMWSVLVVWSLLV